VAEDGKADPAQVGVDGIKGTAPVGSFKMNVLGFYDLGGTAREWMWDGLDEKTGHRVLRGGYWGSYGEDCAVAYRNSRNPGVRIYGLGFRVALSSVP
jgi:formylglycine-generating enzyme required for sulfatase activity